MSSVPDAGPPSEQIARFMAVTQCDAQQARFMLEATNGNFEMALHTFYEQFGQMGMEQAPVAPAVPAPGAQRYMPPRPRAPVAPPTPAQRTFAASRTLTTNVLRLPFVALRSGLGLAWTTVMLSVSVAAFMGDRVLPPIVMRGIRGTVAALGALPDDLDPTEQARQFIHSFKQAYGDRHPRFVETGIKQAITQAKNEFKFVFAYIHSPEHQDSDRFCSDVLCSPDLVTYVNEHFVSWGGDVRLTDAFQLSHRLGVTGYPYVALLNTTPNNQLQLVAAFQGMMAPEMMLLHIAQAVERHGAMLVAQRAELQEREFARRLREEQNQEYEQALAADRERQARRDEERAREEQERREREEAEERERAGARAEEQRKADLASSIARRREEKQAALPAEPGPSEPAPTALVRLRLPDGGSTQRRFLATQLMQHVFDFVDSLESTNYLRYNLVSSYPRRIFARDGDDAGLSLQDAGLAPQAALFVQPEEE